MTVASFLRWLRERVPYASRRDVGGGLTMAAFALVTLLGLIWCAFRFLLPADSLLFIPLVTVTFASPITVPAAFVVGTLVWRYGAGPEPSPRRGKWLGAGTALVSLCIVALGTVVTYLLIFQTGSYWDSFGVVGGITGIVWYFLFALWIGLLTTGWFVIPMGLFAGWYHERNVAFGTVEDEVSQRPGK